MSRAHYLRPHPAGRRETQKRANFDIGI